jgi:RNA polymerase sigma-70 factor, ECF subfamily
LAAASAGRATGIEGRVAPEADATRELYERYSGQIFGYCLHRLGNREEAEDAAQSTFLNAFRGFARGVVPESESAWLFKIAENVCHSRHRSSWRRGRVESPSDLDAFQDVLPAPPRSQDELIPLGEALERLPENQRRAILLREWQGLSYREIGEELGLSQSAVETVIFRARRSLVDGLESPPVRRRRMLRRTAHGVDAGGILATLKALFATGAAVKVAAVAVAVTGASVAQHRHHAVRAAVPAPRPVVRPHVTRRPAPAVARVAQPAEPPVVVRPAVIRPRVHRRPTPPARVAPAVRHVSPSAPAAPPPPPPERSLSADPPPAPQPGMLDLETPPVTPTPAPRGHSHRPPHEDPTTTTSAPAPPPTSSSSTTTTTPTTTGGLTNESPPPVPGG